MAKESYIQWCDSTFNPWIGCTKISPACDNCYAAVSTPVRSMSIPWGSDAPRHRTSTANWREPLKWNKRHSEFFAKHGRRRRVFCASLSDVFDNEVDQEWRRDLFNLIELTPNLDWLLLTKRIGNVFDMVRKVKPFDWFDGQKNVWLGITVVNQEEADRDIPKLLEVPAQVRWLSIEPLLGYIDLRLMRSAPLWAGDGDFAPCRSSDRLGLLWIIAGGESGRHARDANPYWFRSIRDQCAEAGVPFFMKQMSKRAPIPDDLMIREFPKEIK